MPMFSLASLIHLLIRVNIGASHDPEEFTCTFVVMFSCTAQTFWLPLLAGNSMHKPLR
jgi:hypothetical protein